MNHNYVQVWKNNTRRAFNLFQAAIEPSNAGKVPPPDYELPAGGEYTLSWTANPPNGDGTISGYIRFWSIPSKDGLPGSGLTFGVKIEEDFVNGKAQPIKILTYVGSPTGNPNSWTDVTNDFDPDYNFFFRGEGMLESYGVNIKHMLGPRASIAVTIETLYMEPSEVIFPGSPNYMEEWVNDSDRTFDLESAVVEIPKHVKPTKVIKPSPGSQLHPRGVAVLAWSCEIPEGSGQTYGYLRYWSVKPVPGGPIGGGQAFGVMVDQLFAASAAGHGEGPLEPPQIKVFNGYVSAAPHWEDITEQLRLHNSYTFVVKHEPHDYLVTVEQLMAIPSVRCAVRVTIKNAPM